MLLDTLGLFAFILAGHLIGRKILNRYASDIWDGFLEMALFTTAIGLVVISYLTTLASLIGGLYPLTAYLTLLLIFFIGRNVLWGYILLIPNIRSRHYSPYSMCLSVVLLFFIVINYFSAVSPIFGGAGSDDVSYQIAIPKLFTVYHQFVMPWENVRAFLPLNINMLYTYAILINGTEIAKLVNFAFGVGLFFVTYYLAMHYVREKNCALLSGLIAYTNPVTIHNGAIGYIGLGLTFYFMVALIALLRWYETNNRIWLLLSGCFWGFLFGSSYIGFLFLASAISVFIFEWKKWNPSHSHIWIFSGLCILLSAPWMIKNLIVSGNMLFPMMHQWTTHAYLSAASLSSSSLGTGHNPLTQTLSFSGLILLPWNLLMKGNWYYFWGGLGHLFFIYIPVFLLVGQRKQRKPLYVLFLTGLTFIVLWYLVKATTIRYMIAVIPLLSIITAQGFHLALNFKLSRFANYATLALAIAYSSVVLLKENKERLDYVLHWQSKEQFLSEKSPYYTASMYLNLKQPTPHKVFICGDIHPIYLNVPSIGPHYSTYDGDWYKDDDWIAKSIDELKQNSVTHILADTQRFWNKREVLNDSQHFREVFNDGDVFVYEVNYD